MVCFETHCIDSCGTCDGGAVCGGSGIDNLCAIPNCVPESDQAFCARIGTAPMPAPDNCGVPRVAACNVSPRPLTWQGYDSGIPYDTDAGFHCVTGVVPLNPNCLAGFVVHPQLTFTTYQSVVFYRSSSANGLGPYETNALPGLDPSAANTNTLRITDLSTDDVSFGTFAPGGVRDRTHFVLGFSFSRSAPMGTDCGERVIRCWGKGAYFIAP